MSVLVLTEHHAGGVAWLRLNRPPMNPLSIYQWLFEKTDGRFTWLGGLPVLLLRTLGRKSRLERTAALVYLKDGNDLVVVASNGGRDKPPGWFFNVQTKLDMHIRWPRLGTAFAVEKPGHLDGVPTLSVQFFDKDGQSAFKVFLSFGGKQPSAERRAKR